MKKNPFPSSKFAPLLIATSMRRHLASLIALLCVLAPLVNAATPVYVTDWCNLDLPEHSGGYGNVSTMLKPNQDAESAMRNLLAGKTIRAVSHLDTGRVEHTLSLIHI